MMILNPYRFAASDSGGGSDSDPSFSSVVYLTHAEGNLDNQASSGATVSNSNGFGTPAKFGAQALTQDNQGSTTITLASNLFGEFTLEFWLRAAGSSDCFFSTPNGWYLYNDALSTPGGSIQVSFESLVGKYVHVAFTRDESNQVRLFFDGVQQGRIATTATAMQRILAFGRYYPNDNLRAQGSLFDDIRVTDGVCRYKSNFAPPVAAFPNK